MTGGRGRACGRSAWARPLRPARHRTPRGWARRRRARATECMRTLSRIDTLGWSGRMGARGATASLRARHQRRKPALVTGDDEASLCAAPSSALESRLMTAEHAKTRRRAPVVLGKLDAANVWLVTACAKSQATPFGGCILQVGLRVSLVPSHAIGVSETNYLYFYSWQSSTS